MPADYLDDRVAARDEPAALPIRVVIADDHQMMVEMLQRCLLRDGFDVVGTALTGAAALELIAAHRPDVVLLDVSMPGMDGVEVAQRVRTAYPETAVLILTGHTHIGQQRALVRLGVHGYLHKTEPLSKLVATIRDVAQGRMVLDAAATITALANRTDELTEQEGAVLELLAAGQRTAGIAEKLSTSQRTVHRHLAALRIKLDASSPAELVVKAQQHGLLLSPTPDN